MDGVFALLLLASIIGLAWGLAAPTHLARTLKTSKLPTRRRIGSIFGLFAALFFILVGITTPQQPASTPTKDLTLNPINTEHQPTITTKDVAEANPIQYSSKTVEDSTLAKGKTEVKVAGVNGIKTSIYAITYSDGKQISKDLISEEITTKPVTQVIAVGTYVAPTPKANCDPNYSGACVPNVYPADVDCAGGSGNGPYYVQGPVYVTGIDRYGLDSNHDGVGCQ